MTLFFLTRSGKPMECQRMMIRHFIPSLIAAKLPRVRFHDLRHTYASLLIEQGKNIKYIQNQVKANFSDGYPERVCPFDEGLESRGSLPPREYCIRFETVIPG